MCNWISSVEIGFLNFYLHCSGCTKVPLSINGHKCACSAVWEWSLQAFSVLTILASMMTVFSPPEASSNWSLTEFVNTFCFTWRHIHDVCWSLKANCKQCMQNSSCNGWYLLFLFVAANYDRWMMYAAWVSIIDYFVSYICNGFWFCLVWGVHWGDHKALLSHA